MFEKIIENVKEKTPLVHNITNYVTVNDCANIVLACGGSPIMSDDIEEVEEITSICNALVINIGTLNARTVDSMIKAGKKANELSHPVILDPVGAGASRLRTDTVYKLLENIKFSVIRGNISEIKTVALGTGTTKGVDADEGDVSTVDEIISFAKNLSKKTGAVIAITGKIDVVANSEKSYIIYNGNALMSKITGTGCMLTSVIGAFCGANPNNILDAAVTAVCTMGLCGELAYKDGIGTSSYREGIIDQMSNMTIATLNGGAKVESK